MLNQCLSFVLPHLDWSLVKDALRLIPPVNVNCYTSQVGYYKLEKPKNRIQQLSDCVCKTCRYSCYENILEESDESAAQRAGFWCHNNKHPKLMFSQLLKSLIHQTRKNSTGKKKQKKISAAQNVFSPSQINGFIQPSEKFWGWTNTLSGSFTVVMRK